MVMGLCNLTSAQTWNKVDQCTLDSVSFVYMKSDSIKTYTVTTNNFVQKIRPFFGIPCRLDPSTQKIFVRENGNVTEFFLYQKMKSRTGYRMMFISTDGTTLFSEADQSTTEKDILETLGKKHFPKNLLP